MEKLEFKKEFAERLKKADTLLFFTGAGISAESGIATFRGKDGLWNKLKPEELANFNAFMKNPDMVWEWYQYRRQIVDESKPNNGHKAIVDFEKFFKVYISTQNVDNLHARAGSTKIEELHGSIVRNFCIDCKTFYNHQELKFEKKVPHCEKCNGLIRPDVVWFGENLRGDAFPNSEKFAKECDICFVVGTSAIVYPAAYIPQTAKNYGAYIVEINIEPTELTYSADYSIFGKSGEILPQIFNLAATLKI
ncbi:MAG: NAD-dependent deacylase [Ignavibacteriae bacterium]|nr:NAD-dependent deacylase [Ignavibacteriota bacterium]MCB9206018.1 NAD-dependent deacylase [Ignavibacteriales bacterium]MCB9209293.1 NAD-dependent deacylase [Ignavibacteriales bacterium]MCB9257937.1 NAD-dependent deacylase [Ignavibacteriales bacterium]